jgi:hypothetical protein
MKQRMIFLMICFMTGLLITTPPSLMAQTTWHVDDDALNDPGPGDPSVSDPLEDGSADHPFDAIQECINAATGGDAVLVSDGTYTGTGNRDIDFNGKAITVESENGAEYCIIDCQANDADRHRGFYFHNGEGIDSILRGFTIRNGYHPLSGWGGSGIYCDGASPFITKNIITDNDGTEMGIGICCVQASPMIVDNVISNNTTTGGINNRGGGIYCGNLSPIIKGNLITNNWCFFDGGGVDCSFSSAIITGNIITDNFTYYRGAGIFADSSFALIANNVISNNISDTSRGGGIHCEYSEFGDPSIINNLIMNNYAHYGCGGVYQGEIINCTVVNNTSAFSPGGAHVRARNCIIWGNSPDQVSPESIVTYSSVEGGHPGAGNIDSNPLFVTGPLGDFYLSQTAAGQSVQSPCVDAGDPVSALIPGTTRTDELRDTWIIDMGYHYPSTNRFPELDVKFSFDPDPPGFGQLEKVD